MARAGERLDRALGRDPREPVTIDLDATQVTVYGQRKQGAARSRHGSMSYAPHVATWAQRGRALTCELVGGNREKLSGVECARIARRAIALLPAGHGPVTMRIDSAYYAIELLAALRDAAARFTVSVPRNQAMWKALAADPRQRLDRRAGHARRAGRRNHLQPGRLAWRAAATDRAPRAVQRR